MSHFETHRVHRIGWLRASVLGANDGIVSTASLVIGIASAGASHADLMTTGIAGLVAGAMSMAAGEYVSVSSQADTERSDLQREKAELETDADNELNELTEIYVLRGLDAPLARQVAEQLTAHDALGAHARDELGISKELTARPIQAALASALTFALGAGLPLGTVALTQGDNVIAIVSATSLLSLALLGGFGAHAGGAKIGRAALRVTLWGAFAMGVTAAVGAAFGTVV